MVPVIAAHLSTLCTNNSHCAFFHTGPHTGMPNLAGHSSFNSLLPATTSLQNQAINCLRGSWESWHLLHLFTVMVGGVWRGIASMSTTCVYFKVCILSRPLSNLCVRALSQDGLPYTGFLFSGSPHAFLCKFTTVYFIYNVLCSFTAHHHKAFLKLQCTR